MRRIVSSPSRIEQESEIAERNFSLTPSVCAEPTFLYLMSQNFFIDIKSALGNNPALFFG